MQTEKRLAIFSAYHDRFEKLGGAVPSCSFGGFGLEKQEDSHGLQGVQLIVFTDGVH
jgi:hypothetical protein